MPSPLHQALRPSAANLPESGISRVFRHGLGRPGLIPLWAGEGDLPTPPVIANRTVEALTRGETFYTHQRGIPDLRAALARYHERLYAKSFSPDEFFVTGGGMQAIQLAVQMTVGAGDEVLVPTPAWPNFRGAIETTGARAVAVRMTLGRNGWELDIDALASAITAKTRAIVVNSPSNPTGWTASQGFLSDVLDLARAKNLWIIADEIYGRFHFAGGMAPSFQTIRRADDRILFVQTFSKNWAMTGWRMGWLQAPADLGQTIENLIQYNSSGVAQFMQRGGIAALEDGESFALEMIERARVGRAVVSEALSRHNNVRFSAPEGAFYAFFAVDGITDSLDAALRLVDEANIGLAPGTAFGDGGEDCFRICFLRSPDQLREAMQRLSTWLTANTSSKA
ncbi:MAG TPA: pyridoxal phosphate-dependent aminotransferase [Hyphomicrobiaceae bacterium]|nr:pyridoxal phosphate-dependent aminotransferase [Hyphomicrobiaceae bacterium]